MDSRTHGRCGLAAFLLCTGLFACDVEAPETESPAYPAMTTIADYQQAMEELSNWGRWGPDDELGAANLITPAKRREAAALVTEGLSVSLAHDVAQEMALDASTILDREVMAVSGGRAPPTGISTPGPITASSVVTSMPSIATSCTKAKGTTVWRWRTLRRRAAAPRGASTP